MGLAMPQLMGLAMPQLMGLAMPQSMGLAMPQLMGLVMPPVNKDNHDKNLTKNKNLFYKYIENLNKT